MLPGYVESTLGLDFEPQVDEPPAVDSTAFASPRLPSAQVTDRRWPVSEPAPIPQPTPPAPSPHPTTFASVQPEPIRARPETTFYTVQPGDTLFGIARRHGLSVDELLRMNPQIVNPDSLYADQELTVPRR